MNYQPLPEEIRVGDKVACPRCGDTPEVCEIALVQMDGRVLLMRENGVAVRDSVGLDTLRDYGYMLVVA